MPEPESPGTVQTPRQERLMVSIDDTPAPRDAIQVIGDAFAMIPEWVLYGPISDRAVRLFCTLARFIGANESGWPSRRTLADRMGCSVPSVDRAIAELKELAALTTESRRRSDGSGTSSFYYLKTENPNRGVLSPVIGGAITGDEGVLSPVTHHEGEPMKERNTLRQPKPFDADFTTLWATYPKKVDKGAALVRYRTLRRQGVAHGDLVLAVANYVKSKSGDDVKFLKNLATFLGHTDAWREFIGIPGEQMPRPSNIDGPPRPRMRTAEEIMADQASAGPAVPMPENLRGRNRKSA